MADAGMEVNRRGVNPDLMKAMREQMRPHAYFEPPDLAPIITCEATSAGWRGLTEDGEIFNIGTNGAPIPLGGSISILRDGEHVGNRRVPKIVSEGIIDVYQSHLNASTALLRANEPKRALEEIDTAIKVAPTMLARFNRSMVLLALGRWQEGFKEFSYCEQNSPLFMRPQWRAAKESEAMKPWWGEELRGKRILLIHDHGFGDTIMGLRFVPKLQAMGARVRLEVPPELVRIAEQFAETTTEQTSDSDYFCSLLMLTGIFASEISTAPYVTVKDEWLRCWRNEHVNNIGVAWSVGKEHTDDYPRAAPLGEFVRVLAPEANLISVQVQGDAEADVLGVEHFPYKDFAECAALMSLCSEIVTVDTAAVHLAGAIGHPRVTLLLSHWASWRWQTKLYENVRVCQQVTKGDWASAFAKRKEGWADVAVRYDDDNDVQIYPHAADHLA
jgi:hypothetical protein